MDISIIIVSYNVKEYIISCIQSIYKHSRSNLNFEIIVIDNNSIDNTSKKIRNEFSQIILIQNEHNVGYTKAINQGIKLARGKFILLLNPDTLLIEDSLSLLHSESIKHNKLGAIGSKLVDQNGDIHQSAWRKPTLGSTLLSIFHLDFFNYKKNYKDINLSKMVEVDTISGCVFFFKKSIIKKIGFFNENLFWMEDIDFCVRSSKKGFKIIFFPEAKVIHYGGRSSSKNLKVSISNQLISKIKYFKIHHSKISAYLITVSVIFMTTLKSILMLIVIPFSRFNQKKLLAYLYTINKILLKKWS